MSGKSKIEWTEATWNPITGCDKVSPGCKNCYAETFAERFRGVKGHSYEQGFDLKLWPERLEIPLQWKKPRTIFVNSMSDLFHKNIDPLFIGRVFETMHKAYWHTFQVLTKRADLMREYMQTEYATEPPPPNVWLGVSVENQEYADERIPLLLQTPAAVRWISAEPLLGPIAFGKPKEDGTRDPWDSWLEQCTYYCDHDHEGGGHRAGRGIDWVVVGGESGPGARPCRIGWVKDIVRQCKEAEIPVFVKQLGSRPYYVTDGLNIELHLKDRKGGDPAEWRDDDLTVREYPTVAS